MSRQQKWLHLAPFSHGYIAIVCSSEAFCHVGKVCSFHGHTLAHALTHILLHLVDSLCWSLQTSNCMIYLSQQVRAFRVVVKSFQLFQSRIFLLFFFPEDISILSFVNFFFFFFEKTDFLETVLSDEDDATAFGLNVKLFSYSWAYDKNKICGHPNILRIIYLHNIQIAVFRWAFIVLVSAE